MVIFNCYVSLPEGIEEINWKKLDYINWKITIFYQFFSPSNFEEPGFQNWLPSLRCRHRKNKADQQNLWWFTYVYMYMYIYIYICIYICICIYIYMYMFTYIYIHMYIYTLYTYIHIYIYTHIHIYIYIHIQVYIYMFVQLKRIVIIYNICIYGHPGVYGFSKHDH